MICPVCDNRSRVLESRPVDTGASVRRRRECEVCGQRFTTFERYADSIAIVRKRDGRRQAYMPEKLRGGLARAAHKQPDAEAAIESIVAAVEAEARSAEEITTMRIGEICLAGLLEANRISYLRFASVHKELADLDAISAELSDLATSADSGPSSVPTERADSSQSITPQTGRPVHV